MKASLIRFPWSKTEKGQGFFVPCLDTQAIRTLGLQKAVTRASVTVSLACGSLGSRALQALDHLDEPLGSALLGLVQLIQTIPLLCW